MPQRTEAVAVDTPPARAPYPSVVDFFTWANERIRWEPILALAEDHRANGGKFYDVGNALIEAWQWADWLGLIGSAPLQVLDIGTGSGAFPLACQYLGHSAIGMELPAAGDHHAILRQSLGVEIIEHRIVTLRPLAEPPRRFDLITGFRIQFDYDSKASRRWNAAEWSFFLDDLRDSYLTKDGRVAFSPRLDDERVALFERRGGRFVNEKRKLVVFDPLL